MAETPEEQISEQLDVQRYLNIARRRHMHFFIPLLVGWCVVWGASWVLPVSYKSYTLILVEQPTMPKNYVLPNINDDLQNRMQSITQQILSRTRLLLIIDKLNLYAGGRSPITADEKVARMRKDIDIQLVHDAHNEEITAFSIVYSAHDPHVAQQVTSELKDLFITENLKVRQKESEGTTSFIESQLQEASASLAQQEAKVRLFQGAHEGVLPSQQASNLQILSGLQAQLQNEQDTLNTAKQQRVYLQALLEQYRSLHGTSRTGDTTMADLPTIDQEIRALRAQLSDLSSRYTDRYPDVLKVKSQLARTEKLREDFIAGLNRKSNDGKPSEKSAVASGVGDPSQSAPLLQLESQLQANQAEVANRESAIAALKGRINDYQARLSEEPAVEQELADLTRGYDQSKANYDSLLKKKTDSSMATDMEQLEQGERFTMLDPPDLPTKPDFPNRLKFCGFGLLAGLALGLATVVGFEFMDDRLYDEKEIKGMLPVAVISEVPEIRSPSDEKALKRKTKLGWAMAALVLATILAGSAFSILHG